MIEESDKITATSEVVKKVKLTLGGGRGTLLLAIIGIAISLCSSFMFCLASIGFDFTQLTQTLFWSRWVSMSVSALFAYVLVILHKDEVNRLRKEYTDKMKTIAEKSLTAGEEFDLYLKELNLQRRIDWYKRKINGKIAKLNAKLLRVELKGKSTDKINSKIEKYKACVTDEYLEANKYILKTRSKPISAVQVLCETPRGDRGEVNFRSAAAYYGGKALTKLCLSLCMTAAFACVIVQNFGVGINIAAISMTILTILSLLISVVSAIMAANGCYRNVYIPNLQFKLKIIAGFEKWKEYKK